VPGSGKPFPDELTYIVQVALRESGETYKPSPGQLQDHVHHRVAEIAINALNAAGIRMLAPEPCHHPYWRFLSDGTGRTLCTRCGYDTTHVDAMGG